MSSPFIPLHPSFRHSHWCAADAENTAGLLEIRDAIRDAMIYNPRTDGFELTDAGLDILRDRLFPKPDVAPPCRTFDQACALAAERATASGGVSEALHAALEGVTHEGLLMALLVQLLQGVCPPAES